MNCVNFIETQLNCKEDEESASQSSTSTSLSITINVENKENYKKKNKFLKKKNCHNKINRLNNLIKKKVKNSQKNQSRIPSFYCKTKRISFSRNKTI